MIKMFSRIIGVGLVGLLLLGCSSEQDTTTSIPKVVFGSLSQVLAARKAGPPQRVELTATQLASINQPVLQVNPEVFGGTDFLGLFSSRSNSGLGTVQVWQSTDKAHLFLRNGVVVGTRGIGGDIISADADVTIRSLVAGVGRSGIRTYVISDGDVTTTEYKFQCTLESAGEENITVVNQVFKTKLMRESCKGGPRGDSVIRNDYWVQKSTGLLRKSRQWIGPRVGYFELILVKN